MRRIRTASLLFLCLLVAACATDEVGRIQENYSGISPEYVRLGNKASALAQATDPIIHDQVVTDYLISIKRRLLAGATVGNVPGHIFVQKSPSVFAFSVPNGDIFISTGLLKLAQSESELAPVIGHELGHILLGHFRQAAEEEARLDKTVLQSGGPVVSPQGRTSASLAAVLEFGMSRERELAADRVMLQLQAHAGYAVCGAESVFKKLILVDKPPTAGTARTQLFDTHPATPERLRLIETQLKGKGCDGWHPVPSQAYRMNVIDRLAAM